MARHQGAKITRIEEDNWAHPLTLNSSLRTERGNPENGAVPILFGLLQRLYGFAMTVNGGDYFQQAQQNILRIWLAPIWLEKGAAGAEALRELPADGVHLFKARSFHQTFP